MHHLLYDKLRINTFLLQFYGYLARGLFTLDERQAIGDLISKNIDRLELMRDNLKWDGHYDLVIAQDFSTQDFLKQAKEKLKYKQICKDESIAEYLHNHPDFFQNGIMLNDLRKLLDIERDLKNGYMLHDVYHGYKGYSFLHQIDCLDYLYSATHFYNEAYDYFHNRKQVRKFQDSDIKSIPWQEQKRIQGREEVMLRNFREAYINLIFFIESFINSVGYNAFLQGVAQNENDELRLKGIRQIKKDGSYRYSTIRDRITDFARIIGENHINLSVDPYKTYLEHSVELRNQYVHSSPTKPKIRLTIDDWKNMCDELIDGKCFELLEAFWKSCYASASFPKIIYNEFYGSSFKGRPGQMYALD